MKNSDPHDLIWGCEEIGRVINRSTEQTYVLINRGVLDPAIRRLGHRTIVASRTKLLALVTPSGEPPAAEARMQARPSTAAEIPMTMTSTDIIVPSEHEMLPRKKAKAAAGRQRDGEESHP